jgi:Asp-tRNA(Asn)/Glu-tRNA(Gln) amidotransferase A subunit family amidase
LHQSQQESSEEQARLKAEISRLESEQKTIFEQLEQQVAEKQLFETQYAQFQDEFEAHHQEHQELMLTHKQLLKEKQDLEAELAAWPAKAESMMQQQAESRFGPLVRELDEQKAMASQRETQLQQQHQLQMVNMIRNSLRANFFSLTLFLFALLLCSNNFNTSSI